MQSCELNVVNTISGPLVVEWDLTIDKNLTNTFGNETVSFSLHWIHISYYLWKGTKKVLREIFAIDK